MDSTSHNASSNEHPYNKYQTHIQQVMEIWSQKTFVQYTDLSPQHFITQFLLKSLSLIQDHYNHYDYDPNTNATPPPPTTTTTTTNNANINITNSSLSTEMISMLIQGVTFRLESSQWEIRRHGMKMAESLASLVGQSLCFEELRDYEKQTEEEEQQQQEEEQQQQEEIRMKQKQQKQAQAQAQQSTQIMTKEKSSTRQDEVSKKKHKKKTKKAVTSPVIDIDPDDEYKSEDDDEEEEDDHYPKEEDLHDDDNDDDDDSIWNSDSDNSNDNDYDSHYNDEEEEETSSLLPYDVYDDEQDLHPIPTPHYLSECLQLLRSHENDKDTYDQHLVSLQSLPKIISSRPPDLPDFAIPLTKDVLHLENKFDMPNFEQLQKSCLIALGTAEPILVGEYLIQEKVLEDGLSLGTRLEILHVIGVMSEELSGLYDLRRFRERNSNVTQKRYVN